MSPNTIESIATELHAARESGELVAQHPIVSLDSLQQAYEVQTAQMALYAEEVIGWKIGPTSEAKLAAYGIHEPLIAPVYASKCYRSGARFPVHMPHRPKLEAEFALRLCKDVDAEMAASGRSAIRSAVEVALPAIEIVGFRYVEPDATALKVVADGGANAGVIVGESSLSLDTLSGLRIDVAVDGQAVTTGGLSELLWDDVLDSVVWLAQHRVLKKRGLLKGDMIFTGAATALVPIEPEQTVSVGYGNQVLVTASFCDAAMLD